MAILDEIQVRLTWMDAQKEALEALRLQRDTAVMATGRLVVKLAAALGRECSAESAANGDAGMDGDEVVAAVRVLREEVCVLRKERDRAVEEEARTWAELERMKKVTRARGYFEELVEKLRGEAITEQAAWRGRSDRFRKVVTDALGLDSASEAEILKEIAGLKTDGAEDDRQLAEMMKERDEARDECLRLRAVRAELERLWPNYDR